MQKKDQATAIVPQAVQELLRSILTAIRAVKLYPQKNPLYLQTIHKSHRLLEEVLKHEMEFRLSVTKSGLFYKDVSMEKEAHAFKSIVSDLYSRGIREITFTYGLSETELREFYTIITLPPEELKLQGSTESILWERGVSHVRITDASLDAVVKKTGQEDSVISEGTLKTDQGEELRRSLSGKAIDLSGKKVILADLIADPAGFGNLVMEIVRQAGGSREDQQGYLLDVYRETGYQMLQQFHEQREPVFDALARSVLTLEPEVRKGLISGRLYPEVDRQALQSRTEEMRDQFPHDLHERLSMRFSRSWTVPQVSTLLQEVSAAREKHSPGPGRGMPITEDLSEMVRQLSSYTPEEMEALRRVSDAGRESDTLQAVVSTLINVMPLAQYPLRSTSHEDSVSVFSRIVSLLEDTLTIVLDKGDYDTAARILAAFRTPVEPMYRGRIMEAVKKAGDPAKISELVHTLRGVSKDSAHCRAIYAYLSLLDREATPVLLEMLSEEEDRSVRRVLVQILKDLGKNQIALLGERLSDERWYFVRNIIVILGESRKEEVIGHLEKVARHRNFQIRQEVVRALITIGGRKAAALLSLFLKDKDIDIRFMAVRGLGILAVSGEKEERVLVDFLCRGTFRKNELELKKEAVESLGKIGGTGSIPCLRKITKVRWWKAKKPQMETREVAQRAIAEIWKRSAHAGKA